MANLGNPKEFGQVFPGFQKYLHQAKAKKLANLILITINNVAIYAENTPSRGIFGTIFVDLGVFAALNGPNQAFSTGRHASSGSARGGAA